MDLGGNRSRRAADAGPRGAGGDVFSPYSYANTCKRLDDLIRSAQPKHAAALAAARHTSWSSSCTLPSTSRTTFEAFDSPRCRVPAYKRLDELIRSAQPKHAAALAAARHPSWSSSCPLPPISRTTLQRYGHSSSENKLNWCPLTTARLRFAELQKRETILPKEKKTEDIPKTVAIKKKKRAKNSTRSHAKEDGGRHKAYQSKYVEKDTESESIFSIKMTRQDREYEEILKKRLPSLIINKNKTYRRCEQKRYKSAGENNSVSLPFLPRSAPQLTLRGNSYARSGLGAPNQYENIISSSSSSNWDFLDDIINGN